VTREDAHGGGGSNTPLYSQRSSMLSASIAVYRPQAELFGGRCDGKLVVRWGKG
jgi:hypothetical protein